MTSRTLLNCVAAAALLCLPSVANAAEKKISASTSDGAAAEDGSQTKWIKRHVPTRHLVELGPYFGMLLPSSEHEFFEADLTLPEQGFNRLPDRMFDFGMRLGYFPIRHLGFEVEGGAMAGRTNTDEAATLVTVRGHLIAQIGLWRITPFLVAGGGSTGVRSKRSVLGDDSDLTAHFGIGAKLYVNRWLAFRVDGRDVLSAKRGDGAGITHNIEVLGGMSFVLGRPKPVEPAPAPIDSDGDGLFDPDDHCPNEPADTDDGCPIGDADGDGVLDPDDACPDVAADTPDGCPIPDSDGDGKLDPDDACPNEPADTDDGCPIGDTDGDGLLDPDDKCPTDPETKNGFKDDDGCPDEVPEALVKFEGAIEGITFATGKATIRKSSFPVLDNAASVLAEFPGVRLEVSGHTDNVGSESSNKKLSRERADAVKAYLVSKGIGADRIETRGAGPSEPVADNKSRKGRAKNRRIEFHVLSDAGSKPTTERPVPAEPKPAAQ